MQRRVIVKHEKVQARIRKLFKFPDDATVAEVIVALVDRGEFAYATEMLFGCTRDDEVVFFQDLPGYMFDHAYYIHLLVGQYQGLLKMMAQHHHWQNRHAQKGYSFEVFPNEYLVIPEPFATQMLKVLFKE